MPEPLGYMVVRDEDGALVADWDAESHPTYDEAKAEIERALTEEPLYEWFLIELHPAQVVP